VVSLDQAIVTIAIFEGNLATMSDREKGRSAPLRVAVLAYPGCFASEVFGVPDLLTMATHVADADDGPTYDVSVVSPRHRVTAAGGLAIKTTPIGDTDVLIVPGFELTQRLDLDLTLSSLAIEVDTIRRLQSQGVAIVSICVGAFLLGDAGLLDGRDATTSWMFADRLARRNPSTRVRADRLVVTDRGITTTAAFSAMYDFALGLVRQHHGPDIARATARIALVDDARSTQTPFVDSGLLPTTGAGFSRSVQRWLDQRLGDRYDLAVLSQAFNVSTRTMLRRFGEEASETPLNYLHRSRVRRARHLLESTDQSISSIAAQVGYHDASTFARLFARHVERSPRDYRQTFQRSPT
jgi:transcriptional regulator GlxA family with amidase domain